MQKLSKAGHAKHKAGAGLFHNKRDGVSHGKLHEVKAKAEAHITTKEAGATLRLAMQTAQIMPKSFVNCIIYSKV